MIDIVKIKTGQYGEKPLSKVRVFISQKKGNPVKELFTGERFNKPHILWRKEVVPLVMIEQMIASNVKVSWSQKAGCSCGCSPGFILDIHPAKVGYEAIWVTIK